MGWIIFGFVFAMFMEKCFQVMTNYEQPKARETHKVQNSLPWYGWGLASYAVLKGHKKNRLFGKLYRNSITQR